MSHHLDTPLAAQSGQLHLDDLYVFDGERGTVLMMDVNTSVSGADARMKGPSLRAASSGVVTRAYWITECGVAVRRVTLICSRSIMSPTRGLISFFQ